METIFSEFSRVLPAGQVIALMLLAYIVTVLKQVRDQVREINGSMRVMKEWQKGHELLDDERFKALMQGQRDSETRQTTKDQKLRS